MSDLVDKLRSFDPTNDYSRTMRLAADRIEELENPGFYQFVNMAEQWLINYPPDIFTGESGDPGPLFAVAIRAACEELAMTQTPNNGNITI